MTAASLKYGAALSRSTAAEAIDLFNGAVAKD
jgi:hypothetical protein